MFTNAHKKECEYVKQIPTTWSNLMNAENTTNYSFVCFGFLKEKKIDIWLENALQSQQEQEAAITQSF